MKLTNLLTDPFSSSSAAPSSQAFPVCNSAVDSKLSLQLQAPSTNSLELELVMDSSLFNTLRFKIDDVLESF
ncbi:hypothetical protein F2Q68_00042495 [Brassica cretica]|uniref:Uncharacterized protein n=1 Tax=Brassica cretica TaxID=69181 RepID=A0A8S9MHP6_BRACR|nr:hypothetical protein F2Q68_00042495 [Brassica cretica]